MSANALLIENHDAFLLEPGELEFTNHAKHEIQAVDDESFKERFQRIPPPMVEEVRAHVKEILYTLAKAHGVMLLCWSERKTEVCTSA